MSTWMITGAGGILAEELISQTIANNTAKIVAVSKQADKLAKKYDGIPQITCIGWDELSAFDFSTIDALIHCAFARIENGADISDALGHTQDILTLLGKSEKKIPTLQISSRSIYGQQEPLWTEEMPPAPTSLYALGKVSQELLLRQAAEAYGFPATSLRLAGLICPRMKDRLVYKLVDQAVRNRRFKIVGGMQQFALLDVRDAAAGISALLTTTDASQWQDIYNLGTMERLELRQIAEMIQTVAKDQYGLCISVEWEEKELCMVDGMDCTRFNTQASWQAQYSMRDIISSLFAHCIKELQAESTSK